MDDNKSSITSTVLAAAAFVLIGLALAAVTWWLYTIMSATYGAIDQYGVRVTSRASRATIGMVVLAIATAIGAVFFIAAGGYTLWLGLTKFRAKPAAADNSWKDMPYPKG